MSLEKILGIASLCLLLNACDERVSKQIDKTLTDKIDSLLEETSNRFKIPGMAISVTRNDSVIYQKAFGVKNIETGEKLTTKNVFHWASVSKTFVTVAILQLVEQGKISLDEKLVTYLPYFKLKSNWYKNITIKQLLNHTAGIKDVEDYQWERPQNEDEALDRYVRSMEADEMDFENGTDFHYSNAGFEILGDVIAKVSGLSFEQYMKKNILEPLEMKSSSFFYPEIPEELRVRPHFWKIDISASKIYPYNRIHAPSSTLNSNVEDMSRWALALLKEGQLNTATILSKKSCEQMWTGTRQLEKDLNMGLCWFLTSAYGKKVVLHSGSDLGFQSFLLLCPEKKISIVFVSNYENTPAEDITGAVFTMMLGKKSRKIRQPMAIPYAETLKKEGIIAANKFYEKAKADTSSYLNDQDTWIFTSYSLFENDSTLKDPFISLLRKNKEIRSASSDALFYLGYGFNEIGNSDSAKIYTARALEADPANEDALELMETIKKGK